MYKKVVLCLMSLLVLALGILTLFNQKEILSLERRKAQDLGDFAPLDPAYWEDLDAYLSDHFIFRETALKINNLSFRIPFIISITFILCMFVIVLIITVVSSKSIEDTAIKGLRVAAKSYSDMIDLYFSEKRLVMDLYSKDPNLARYLVNPTEENKLAAEASFKRVYKRSS